MFAPTSYETTTTSYMAWLQNLRLRAIFFMVFKDENHFTSFLCVHARARTRVSEAGAGTRLVDVVWIRKGLISPAPAAAVVVLVPLPRQQAAKHVARTPLLYASRAGSGKNLHAYNDKTMRKIPRMIHPAFGARARCRCHAQSDPVRWRAASQGLPVPGAINNRWIDRCHVAAGPCWSRSSY